MTQQRENSEKLTNTFELEFMQIHDLEFYNETKILWNDKDYEDIINFNRRVVEFIDFRLKLLIYKLLIKEFKNINKNDYWFDVLIDINHWPLDEETYLARRSTLSFSRYKKIFVGCYFTFFIKIKLSDHAKKLLKLLHYDLYYSIINLEGEDFSDILNL